jgi:hypothetical protein
MIELNSKQPIKSPIRCSGRASDGPNTSAPFAIVFVELASAEDPTSDFTINYDDPECVNQSGAVYPDQEESKYFVAGAARGVKDAAAHYESLGVSLRGLQARVVKLVAHEIDSNERAFWNAAKNAMAACLVNVQK